MITALFLFVLLLLCVLSVLSGPALPFATALGMLLEGVPPWQFVSPAILELRFVHVLIASGVGFALSVGGRSMQLFLRNPLADPHVVGLSAGSTTALLLFFLIFPGLANHFFWGIVPVYWGVAFAGAIVAVILFQMIFGTVSRRWGVASMALVGLLINAACAAALMLIFARMSPSQLSQVQVWTLGAIQPHGLLSTWLLLIPLLTASFFLIRLDGQLRLLSFGSEFATSHGVSLRYVRRVLLVSLMVVCAASVCAAGSIGFVGLMVPHLSRRLFFTDSYARQRPWLNGILGAIVLVCADFLSRVATAPSELPVGVYTALIATPFLMYVLLKRGAAA